VFLHRGTGYARIPAKCHRCIWKLRHSRNYDNWRLPWSPNYLRLSVDNFDRVRNSHCDTMRRPAYVPKYSLRDYTDITREFFRPVISSQKMLFVKFKIIFVVEHIHGYLDRCVSLSMCKCLKGLLIGNFFCYKWFSLLVEYKYRLHVLRFATGIFNKKFWQRKNITPITPIRVNISESVAIASSYGCRKSSERMKPAGDFPNEAPEKLSRERMIDQRSKTSKLNWLPTLFRQYPRKGRSESPLLVESRVAFDQGFAALPETMEQFRSSESIEFANTLSSFIFL